MEPFITEIRMAGFDYPPKGWAWCDGQLLPVSQNTALYSLLGTTYGGDGKTTFALPDLQGRSPMQPGQGPGLSQYDLGQISGSETVTLLDSEIPAHSHGVSASQADSTSQTPAGQKLATGVSIGQYANPGALTQLSPSGLASTGGNEAHNNLQPYLTLYFIIALQGEYPARP